MHKVHKLYVFANQKFIFPVEYETVCVLCSRWFLVWDSVFTRTEIYIELLTHSFGYVFVCMSVWLLYFFYSILVHIFW